MNQLLYFLFTMPWKAGSFRHKMAFINSYVSHVVNWQSIQKFGVVICSRSECEIADHNIKSPQRSCNKNSEILHFFMLSMTSDLTIESHGYGTRIG